MKIGLRMSGDFAARLMVLLLAAPLAAEAEFICSTNPSTLAVTITGYDGPGGEVIIPVKIGGNTVTTIGSMAFYCAWTVTRVVIPANITSIGSWAFVNCSDLTNLTVDAANAVYSSVDGVLFNKSKTTLLLFPCGMAGSYSVPLGVTRIHTEAFFDCGNVTNITLPNTVTSIGMTAFGYCEALVSVTLGTNVNTIEAYAFSSCPLLAGITLPDSVTSLGYEVFGSCSSLANVTIPARVSSIGDGAFERCSNITAISVNVANPVYSSFEGVLFNKNQSVLVEFPCGRAGVYVVPAGVTSIESRGFAGCLSLTGVCFRGNPPAIGTDVFNSDVGLTVYYLPGGSGWGAAFGDRPTAVWCPNVVGDTSFGMRTNRFGFNISWASGRAVVVDACTNLSAPVWAPLQTNVFITDTSYFCDAGWINHRARFYRVRVP